MLPRSLLDDEKIGHTELLVFSLLYDRAQLSKRNPEFVDEYGRVFVYFAIPTLAATLHRGETVIKTALKRLEAFGYIERKHRGRGNSDRIYLILP